MVGGEAIINQEDALGSAAGFGGPLLSPCSLCWAGHQDWQRCLSPVHRGDGLSC